MKPNTFCLVHKTIAKFSSSSHKKIEENCEFRIPSKTIKVDAVPVVSNLIQK